MPNTPALHPKERARLRIEQVRVELIELSHRIHANPELAFKETRAAQAVGEALFRGGLQVETGIADLPTALAGRAGSGSLHVAICAEYDALPGIGHACGHNIIAAMAVGAGIGLAHVADEIGLRVTVLGTPAEEDGGGKILMLERGAFEGVHAAMMVHPKSYDMADTPLIACIDFDVRYRGKEAHAAAFPETGINAADAMLIAQTSIGLLRQHILPTDRIHGIVTKGGDAPNIIPALTEAIYTVRSKTLEQLDNLWPKVERCFQAGAIATGATLEIKRRGQPYAEVRHDADMVALYRLNAEALGRRFPEVNEMMRRAAGSTDMGNVSLVIPSIHPSIGIDSLPAANHQPEFAAACVKPAADRAVFDGAVAMAWTAIDLATNPRLRNRMLGKGSADPK
jgi:amidohydrolase